MARIQGAITASDLEKIDQFADALKRLQETEEDLSCLPTLEIEDIQPDIQVVHPSSRCNDMPMECYEQPTSGIFYLSGAAGIGTLPEHLLPLVPFFCNCFTKVGTQVHDYTEISQLIDRYTGGIGLGAQARTSFEAPDTCLPFIALNGKCLARNLDAMFHVIEELMCQYSFSDLTRLKNLLLEYQAIMESGIVQNGHRLSLSLASRHFSRTAALSEAWNGIHQLHYIKTITDRLSADNKQAEEVLTSLAEDLAVIGRTVFAADNVKLALVGEEASLVPAMDLTTSLRKQMNSGNGNGFVPLNMAFEQATPREGWSTSSAVSFVARTFKTVNMTHDDAPALAVISKLLRSMYLHREIREKGGAYGGFALYNTEDGIFGFASYRDPHINDTLKAFEGAFSFITSDAFSETDVKEAVLQVCSDIDKLDTPSMAARKAFYRNIIGLSDETRLWYKKQLLALSRKTVSTVAGRYFGNGQEEQSVAVISGRDKLVAANEKLGDRALTLHQI